MCGGRRMLDEHGAGRAFCAIDRISAVGGLAEVAPVAGVGGARGGLDGAEDQDL